MRKLVVTTLIVATIVVAGITTQGQGSPGPLPQFSGDYRIVEGPSGVVRVAGVMGGAYSEWNVSMGQPSHEIRMLVAPRAADGRFRVWRFEQEPAPAVAHEGTAYLADDQELVAEFPGTAGAGRVLRERWRLTESGGLTFSLEAGSQGEPLRRVGGFSAIEN